MFGAEREQPPSDSPPENETASLEELRRLIVGEQLEQLEQRLDDPERQAQDISTIVAEALELRAARDDKLGEVLAPTIEESLRASVKRDPKNLVDAIFPVMGPAIRKAMADTLARMVQSLNQALEHSLSPRSLRWRWQAWRTGRPFAEVVLLYTLRFRVEQIFLIHAESGLPLVHVQAEAIEARDSDMVSGMLTAIQDFVRDSFGGCEGEELDALRVGELSVWIARGPRAVVAAVIRGSAPLELRGELERCNEHVHRVQGEELAGFVGEVHAFEPCRPQLEACLKQEMRAEPRSRGPLIAAAAFASVILVVLGWWVVTGLGERRRWQSFVERLHDEPGVVVAAAGSGGGRYHITGLRDPLAVDPETLLPEYGLDADVLDAQWEPFDAVHDEFVMARSVAALAPPSTVTMTYAEGAVRIRGTASSAWISAVCGGGIHIAGVHAIDCTAVHATDRAAVVTARATKRLRPPSTIELRFDGGVLRASGAASGEWIEQARVLAYTVEEVERFDDSAVDIAGRRETIMRQAERILGPPPAVSMSLEGSILTLDGTAPTRWIERVNVLAGAIPDVQDVDTTRVVASDRERVILSRVRSATGSPDGVQFRLEGDTVVATGSAPRWWLEQATVRARSLPAVAVLDTSGVAVTDGAPGPLEIARTVLQPPAGVDLGFENGMIVASGAAPEKWIEEARLLARTIPGSAGLNEDHLRSSDLADVLLDRAVLALRPPDGVTLRIDGTTVIATGQASYRWIAEARKLAPLITGISAWGEEGLEDRDVAALRAAVNRIERKSLYFPSASTTLQRGQDQTVAELLTDLTGLARIAADSGYAVRLRIIGDSVATRASLSLDRARAIQRLFTERGVVLDMEVGTSDDSATSTRGRIAENRRVTFDVEWSEPGQ